MLRQDYVPRSTAFFLSETVFVRVQQVFTCYDILHLLVIFT